MKSELLIVRQFVEDHPDETAEVLERVSFNDAAAFLSELDPHLAAQALSRISASLAVDCLRSMHREQVAVVLAALPVDLAVRLLGRASEQARELWLAALSDDVAEVLQRKLRYPAGTAGALADPLVLALPGDLSVADAQKQLRRSAERAYYYVYVVDRDHKLVGVLDIRELMMAGVKDTLEQVMHGDPVRLSAQSDLAAMVGHPAWREFDALPVVDPGGVFFGVVRHRTLRQIVGSAGSQAPVEPVVSTLMNLGELYWTGFSAFLSGMSPTQGGLPAPAREGDIAHGPQH